VELAVQAHLEMQVELAVQVRLEVELQEQEQQAALSAGRMQSRQSANGRPGARW
jgi:hypothetical protein